MDFSTDLFLEYKKRPGRASLARLLERHQDAVYTLCRQVLHHPQDAEDACQEILLEVSRQVDVIEEPAKFPGWLYRTALHSALDFKRQRGRRKIREAGAAVPAAGPPSETTEALHQGLAGLDDTSRALVVEHYFGRRSLRELAAERGCSEVAVWKRIESARERLKKVLGSAAVVALEDIRTVPAPAGMVPKALGIAGGLTMATSVGIKVAIVAPLLLLTGVGTILVARRPAPPPPLLAEVRKPAAARVVPLAPTNVPSSPSAVAGEPPAKTAPRPRRPYPFKDPAPAFPAAAVRTWSVLTSKRVTIDVQNQPLPVILNTLGELTGLSLVAAAGPDAELISMKVYDIVGDSCLRLMLQPRQKTYEILPNGTVQVDSADRIQGGYEKVARQVAEALRGLEQVRGELDRGWDGVARREAWAVAEAELRAKRIVSTQGETTLEEEFRRLKELGVGVHLESQGGIGGGAEELLWRQTAVRTPFVQVVAERSFEDHLQDLARTQGLVSVLYFGSVVFTNEQGAALYRAKVDEVTRVHDRVLENLGKPVESADFSDIPDFLESVGRSHGLNVVPEEAAWNSQATLSLPPGTTLRQALDQLKTHGFRWAVRDGMLYVLK